MNRAGPWACWVAGLPLGVQGWRPGCLLECSSSSSSSDQSVNPSRKEYQVRNRYDVLNSSEFVHANSPEQPSVCRPSSTAAACQPASQPVSLPPLPHCDCHCRAAAHQPSGRNKKRSRFTFTGAVAAQGDQKELREPMVEPMVERTAV